MNNTYSISFQRLNSRSWRMPNNILPIIYSYDKVFYSGSILEELSLPTYLIQGIVLGVTAAAQPGPLQAYLLSLTTRFGWRRALPATFAPLISDGPVLLFVFFVLTSLPTIMFLALQITGGLFLIYLAFGAFKNLRTATSIEPELNEKTSQNVLKAALINLLSPNPYIFWATIAGPIFISGWKEFPRYGIGFLLGFYVALIGGFLAFVALFALTGKLDKRINRTLNGFAALALLLFGLFHLIRGLIQVEDLL
jgi:threonine/homoserine/homoserine lactone efflux protein